MTLLLAGCAKDTPSAKHTVSHDAVDKLFENYATRTKSSSEPTVGAYLSQVKTAVEKNFVDFNTYSGKACTLRISMAPDGSLEDVKKEDGDPEFCRAALAAVKKTDFPKPPSQKIYDLFKNAPLVFRP
ncbi:cell envelope integrity protein TolA [Pseudocitrobacter faecalis]|uniref:cell envelope integrity protein TolA n=1 Tax=Pseudocitrobacter faecalis TaxID=1398493 RepID=UPI003314657A